MTSKHPWISLLALLAATVPLQAADPENCLSCHRYRGLGRVSDDGKTFELYHLDPDYYDRALGPHARLRCTQCHPRDEVGVIPHKPVSAVNCTTQCHLGTSGQVEVRFSHERVADMLHSSVHAPDKLARSNELIGSPLGPNQSHCLLCHNEPTFQWPGETWTHTTASVERCDTCHGPDLPVPMGTRFMFSHVQSRSRRALSNAQIVQLCSRCHSRPEIREEFDLPDTIASYLASFHGKAMLLGDRETAGCLDCHAADSNVHLIRAHTEQGSPTSEAKLPDTCRSPACHPSAGHAVSEAAVHLDLQADGGIEYLIGALFVFMILSTFGPSVVLQCLEMLQIVVGRHDPNQHHREQLVEKLKALPEGRRALVRFTVHQRVQHWILAICFTVLCVTGFPIKFADRAWANWMITLCGGISMARSLHRLAGTVLMVGFVYHFLYIFVFAVRQRRATGKSWLKVIMDLPMVTNPQDIRQLFQQLGYLFFLRKERPALARFSLKEKFEYFGVFWGSALLGVTGLLMWFNAWTTTWISGRVLTVASMIHTMEAFLALLHVGIIHMIGVIFSPVVFPISPAMFSGETPTEELAEAHAGMVDEVARQLAPKLEGGASHV